MSDAPETTTPTPTPDVPSKGKEEVTEEVKEKTPATTTFAEEGEVDEQDFEEDAFEEGVFDMEEDGADGLFEEGAFEEVAFEEIGDCADEECEKKCDETEKDGEPAAKKQKTEE